jgi:2-methylisocitrate lyase-like PEP mutase family enzyme
MDKAEQLKKAEDFAALHHGGRILVLPNPWDVITARVFVKAGFPAVATTSGGVAFAQGYPDGEHISREEMLAVVRRIADGIPVPLSADMEGGYGPTPEDVAVTVKGAIEAGAVGVNIEDGAKADEGLVDFDLAVDRIRAASEAAADTGIPAVINARTDGFHFDSGKDVFDEAVRRANAYREAGAGCLFVPWAQDGELIGALVRQIDGPVNILAAPDTPPVAELQSLGVARVTIGGSLARTTITRVIDAAQELLGPGTFEFARGVITQGQTHALFKD